MSVWRRCASGALLTAALTVLSPAPVRGQAPSPAPAAQTPSVDALVAEIRRLATEGMAIREIARHAGVAVGSVSLLVAALGAARLLGLAPAEVMMVAAHPSDLRAAAACGLRTAYVARPLERGVGGWVEPWTEGEFDIACASFIELAALLETRHSEPARIAEHWRAAGQPLRAVPCSASTRPLASRRRSAA